MQGPMTAVLGANSKRETGKRAQQNNIMAAKVGHMLPLFHLK